MSEAMTTESIVEAEWVLKGYWTKTRFPFKIKTEKGSGWSDVDVLAYNPETNHLVISESKARGRKNRIIAYTQQSQNNFRSILDTDKRDYFTSFLVTIQHKIVFVL